MALGGLFERTPVVTQNASKLQERWAQEGSALIGASGDQDDVPATVHTITTGKTGYIKQIIISSSYKHTGSVTFMIKDGGSGGTIVFRADIGFGVGENFVINLNVPIEISTDIYVSFSSSGHEWNIYGWEE